MTEVSDGWLYVVGDAAGRSLLTHQGKYEARLVAEMIAGSGDDTPWATDQGPPRVVFTDPEVAAVGRTEDDVRSDGRAVTAVFGDLGETAGGSLRGRITGSGKLVIDPTRDVVVGMTIVGPEAGEMIHAATIAIIGAVPVDRLRHAVPPFPTMSEIWLSLLDDYRSGTS